MTEPDRRRFFRIDDNIGVAYRVLSDDEVKAQLDGSAANKDALASVADVNKTIHRLLDEVKVANGVLAELLTAMNSKIDCVINQLEMDSRVVEKIVHEMKQVNISACGLAFKVDQKIEAGQVLALDLLLKPDNLCLYVHGDVISTDATDDPQVFYMRVAFRGMTEADQELLIQQIVQRQGMQLREARQESQLS